MKKLIASLALAAFALTAQAEKQNITIFYGWSAADVVANFHRNLAEQANKQQDKYNFIFDVKPGAGAAIAAMHVEKTPNTILATSSAVWIRPNFFPKESHNVENFRELIPLCDDPITVISNRYKSFAEVPTDKPLTVAVSGLGITTHLVATTVFKKYPNVTVVPFKSTTEAMISTVGGQTDFSVNFVGDSKEYLDNKDVKRRVYMLGVTGTQPVLGAKTFVSQGFDKNLSNMNAPAHLVVPKTMSDTQFKEIRAILFKAATTPEVQNSYKADYCHPLNTMADDRIDPWWNASNVRWKNVASTITLK
jgi:tripartite-type tricarboxylate transporter receptor subunit TctC